MNRKHPRSNLDHRREASTGGVPFCFTREWATDQPAQIPKAFAKAVKMLVKLPRRSK